MCSVPLHCMWLHKSISSLYFYSIPTQDMPKCTPHHCFRPLCRVASCPIMPPLDIWQMVAKENIDASRNKCSFKSCNVRNKFEQWRWKSRPMSIENSSQRPYSLLNFKGLVDFLVSLIQQRYINEVPGKINWWIVDQDFWKDFFRSHFSELTDVARLKWCSLLTGGSNLFKVSSYYTYPKFDLSEGIFCT